MSYNISKSDSPPKVVLFFEQHMDATTRECLKLWVSRSFKKYSTLALEFANDLTQDQIIERVQTTIDHGLKMCDQINNDLKKKNVKIQDKLSELSCKRLSTLIQSCGIDNSKELAVLLKYVPPYQILRDTFEVCKQKSITIKGVDVLEKDINKLQKKLFNSDLLERSEKLEREEVMADQISNLYKQGMGVFGFFGYLHAEKLLEKLKDKDVKVLYYFPLAPGVDNIGMLRFLQKKFNKNYYSLYNKQDIQNFVELVVNEVNVVNEENLEESGLREVGYKREIVNSHSTRLKNIFNVSFRIFERDEHYLDALLNMENVENLDIIVEKMEKGKIRTIKEQKYLVIPEINVTEVSLLNK